MVKQQLDYCVLDRIGHQFLNMWRCKEKTTFHEETLESQVSEAFSTGKLKQVNVTEVIGDLKLGRTEVLLVKVPDKLNEPPGASPISTAVGCILIQAEDNQIGRSMKSKMKQEYEHFIIQVNEKGKFREDNIEMNQVVDEYGEVPKFVGDLEEFLARKRKGNFDVVGCFVSYCVFNFRQ